MRIEKTVLSEEQLFVVGKAIHLTKTNIDDIHEKTGYDKATLILAVNLTYGLETKKYFLIHIYDLYSVEGERSIVSSFVPHESYLADNFFFDELAVDKDGYFDLSTDNLAEFKRIYLDASESEH